VLRRLRPCPRAGANDVISFSAGNGLRMVRFFRVAARVFLAAAAAALAACSAIPNSGPSAADVAEQADPPSGQRYELVDITSPVIEALRSSAGESFQAHFGDYRPSVEPRIGIGDAVVVTIWEAGQSGLFSPASISGAPAATAQGSLIPEQVVGRDGAITVPFAGRVEVAGRTVREVQAAIEHGLAGKAIQPQALVNVTRPVGATVTVTGEVTAGARVPLSVKGDRVLDVIAVAGGVRYPVNETYIQLTRGKATVRVPMTRVAADPRENIYLRPDDVLTVIRDPQTFIAYGATGQNAEIPFNNEGITLAQALAKAGGLLDLRADAEGVFVFRSVPEGVARALRPESALVAPGRLVPVVFRLNLHDPASLFAAQSFRMANRDLLYVSNAPITNVQKAFSIFSQALGPAATAANVCLNFKC
jgi:polysaccharide biosynthesis/export protein